MRWQDMYIAGLGTCLGDPVPPGDAVAAGLLDAERAARFGYESVLVAGDDLHPPEMAVRAGRVAVSRSGHPAEDFVLVLHASTWWQGLAMYPTASYVANGAVGPAVPAFDVQQRCNGALGALELAAAHLHGAPSAARAALVTSADRFTAPAIDRWNALGIGFHADGGAALVLSRDRGFARLLATVSIADNSTEATARGNEPFTAVPGSGPIDLVARFRDYTNSGSEAQDRVGRVRVAGERAKEEVLREAGVTRADVDWVLVTANRGTRGDEEFHERLGFPNSRTNREFGATTGHLGAADQFAALAHLLETGQLKPNELVLMVGGGAGYTCTTVLLEIIDPLPW